MTIGIGVAGLIIAFVIFAELYSIKDMLSRNIERRNNYADIVRELNDARRNIDELKDATTELINLAQSHCGLTESEQSIINHAKYIISKCENSS